jgi:hypothetical protein
MKSIDRISASMAVVIAALRLKDAGVRRTAGGNLGVFLKHRFPRVSLTFAESTCTASADPQIRSMCAEQLYLELSDTQDEVHPELEEVLIGTVWTEDEGFEEAADQVVHLVQQEIGQ